MLVLSRKKGEKIVLSHVKVEIIVVSIKGSRVRLGISAPTEIAVRSREIAVNHGLEPWSDGAEPREG